MKNPIPPLSNPITDKPASLTWSAYFTNLKLFIDNIAANIAIRIHNDLEQLQGGTTTERYHLTATQHTAIGNIPTFNGNNTQFLNGAGDFATPVHNDTQAIQGGVVGERYHLSLASYNKLAAIPNFNSNSKQFLNGKGVFSTPNHNDLSGLNVGNYQHVTAAQSDTIDNINSLIYGYMSLGL
jgi:hypothetical protein